MTADTVHPWPDHRKQERAPRRSPLAGWLAFCIGLSAAVGFFSAEIGHAFEGSTFGRRTTAIAVRLADGVQRMATGAVPSHSAPSKPTVVARSLRATIVAFPVCGSGKRRTCVVDGDTFWFEGEKIRLETIDAPEVEGQCGHERKLAAAATARLAEILSSQALTITRNGVDRYGRTLARVSGSAGEAGSILVREGLARPWAGRREYWCG